ncbi:MAG: OmpA family protein [Bacteroidota bacterium]
MKKLIPFLLLIAITTVSCVPSRLHNELKAQKAKCTAENDSLKAVNLNLNTHNNELSYQNEELKNRIAKLESDTSAISNELKKAIAAKTEISAKYDQLLKEGPLAAANTEANKKLIRDLQKTKEDLQKREDEISKKERELKEKAVELEILGKELDAKTTRVDELEKLIASKDSAAIALKNSVANALTGFTDKGLTVELRNGKVYVMLEERLLFATGSTVVDVKGAEALKALAKVLEGDLSNDILIEGHTDNVPMKGNGEIKDNWDLSVMRATAVVKIITSNSKVSPARLTAAGRGEFNPIDNTNSVEGRKKNRRIEVIITPKLDEIFKVLEKN